MVQRAVVVLRVAADDFVVVLADSSYGRLVYFAAIE
jgi:hypothetical protein